MQLTVNGEGHEAPGECTVVELLQRLELKGPVAVERNGEVVPRAEHAETRLSPNDVIEIVHFVGGG